MEIVIFLMGVVTGVVICTLIGTTQSELVDDTSKMDVSTLSHEDRQVLAFVKEGLENGHKDD